IGIDIDETEAQAAQEIVNTAVQELGETPLVRIGQWPKRLLVYGARELIDSKRVGKCEILAAGKQFVAYGIHPVTGRNYSWPNEEPISVVVNKLPRIGQSEVERFVTRLGARSVAGTSSIQRLNDNTPSAAAAKPTKRKLRYYDGLRARIVHDS